MEGYSGFSGVTGNWPGDCTEDKHISWQGSKTCLCGKQTNVCTCDSPRKKGHECCALHGWKYTAEERKGIDTRRAVRSISELVKNLNIELEILKSLL